MKKLNEQIKLKETPEIREFIKERGITDIDVILKKALESYLEKMKDEPICKVDKWISILDKLVDWANNEGDEDG